LVCALGGSEISTTKSQIRIDDTNKRQIWEVMPFGDKLGSNQNIDLVCLDAADNVRGRTRAPDCVTGH
tara:strand:- start:247 stop:450 length:204 start_codon:yes stop_codon:yes gene_type:complete